MGRSSLGGCPAGSGAERSEGKEEPRLSDGRAGIYCGSRDNSTIIVWHRPPQVSKAVRPLLRKRPTEYG
jgi:hypothetical protein